uniref:Uncharacterized protein n=1 Tax=Pundamilia nyererei TaxID=303518 RepID=A0A3B4HBB1_9CICH
MSSCSELVQWPMSVCADSMYSRHEAEFCPAASGPNGQRSGLVPKRSQTPLSSSSIFCCLAVKSVLSSRSKTNCIFIS